MNYKVWDCKIIVPDSAQLPAAFDWPPRSAAIKAIESHGIQVVGCFSGWGGKMTDIEIEIIEKNHSNGGKTKEVGT